ncbi:response regulator [Vulgatibacter sp.]|uniref:response regulator n=1 Tax=Vulgatibacter sp. TaxID=1971226 RepID=UPI00356AB2ED
MDDRFRLLPEGARVAIVGAGPAGCLLAIALLDAAKARRQPLQVVLFDGGEGRRGRMLVDPAALARLASAGLPLPDAAIVPLQGVQSVFGAASARTSLPIFAAPRGDGGSGDFVAYLRAAAIARGAQLHNRAVEAICPAGDGGWTVRASGASLRAEAVALACGAGSPLAARVEGHQPPPVWRACAADLEVDPEEPGLGPWATRVHGRNGLPDLWLVSAEGDEQAVAVGEDAGPAALAEGLLAAVAAGRLPPMRLRNPRRIFLPAGVARPALPVIGDALGGAPEPWRLAHAAGLAQAMAAAFFDGGPKAMLDCCRTEALRLEPQVRRALRRQRRWKQRSPAVVERAVEREASRAPAWQPVRQNLAASAAPGEDGAGLLLAIRAFFALALAWLLVLWEGHTRSGGVERMRSNRVFVVDDDTDQAELLAEYLESRGVPTSAFRDGMSAVAAAARQRPAAVILDVALPWLDGPTICRVLRQEAAVPVFLTTALPLSLARPEGEAAGAAAVLSKPLDLAGLALRLQPHVQVGPPPELRRQAALPRIEKRQQDAAQPPG